MQALTRSLPFAVLLCAAAYLFTRTLQFDFPHAPGRLGPDIWPQAILVLLMIASAAGIARSLFWEAPSQVEADAPGGPARLPGDTADSADQAPPSRYGLVAGGMLLFLAYPIALEYLGFLVATFLLMVLFMWIGQWRNVVGILAVGALGTLVLFYTFRGIVYVSLPLGSGLFHDWTVWVASVLGMR